MSYSSGVSKLLPLVSGSFNSATFSDGTWAAGQNLRFLADIAPATRAIHITGSCFANNVGSYACWGVVMKNFDGTFSWAGEVNMTPGLTGLSGFYVQLGFNAGVFSGQPQPASGPFITINGVSITQLLTTPNTFVYGGTTLALLPLGGKLVVYNKNNVNNFDVSFSAVAQFN